MSTENGPGALLDTVTNRETFLAFVWSLAEDRRRAEEIESNDPERYKWGGADGWQNQTISSFLEASAAGVAHPSWPDSAAQSPSWKDFALFLWMGKIYE
jgi:hypothetical protein